MVNRISSLPVIGDRWPWPRKLASIRVEFPQVILNHSRSGTGSQQCGLSSFLPDLRATLTHQHASRRRTGAASAIASTVAAYVVSPENAIHARYRAQG